ncbi:RpiR family carbohydrate utilization transcriptional regulator [Litorivivens lipolytica]|uniref:RpiR family carbohydrate utilization transcriptional regulator n=1 Tax=Litorivivens lipolytica TaxID=1524264 RepID=A0A7W4W7S8_9GAMM|nr:transcriptional regulator HexR [Litorivivens lipolytica]MBB3048432.1 RpiR family carbohydrate utilization transcriptional regulator [Litorivivens lipolytica]
MKPRNIIRAIENGRHELRKSERKVADFVLAKAEDVIHMRIVDLAQESNVSEPTVVRFCRAIGCDGFQSFKLALAQHVAHSPRYQHYRFTEQDSAHEYTFKVFDATMETLKRVRDNIDVKAIEKAVDALGSANRVEFYGFGASSAVATDAQHKFFRLQISSSAYSDPHIQAMSAMSLRRGDVVVAISQSGRTQALIDAIHLVRETGATVIGLAPSATPVARVCDLAIHIDVEEDNENYTPLPSRIAHMAVIDILAVGVSRAKGPSVREHLATLNRGLQSLRISREP